MQKITANRPLVKSISLLALISLAFWAASFFPDLVLILIISALLSFILRPLVVLLEFMLGIRRSIAIGIIFLAIGGICAWLMLALMPLVVERGLALYSNLKSFPFDQKLNEATKNIAASIPFMDSQSLTEKIHTMVQSFQESSSQALSSIAGFSVNLLIVPFLTYFILAESDSATKKLIEKVPNKYFEMTLNVLNKIQNDLVGYLQGWIWDSVIVGILNIIGFYIIGVDYAILIGILAGIANLIPYVGPFFGLVPAFLVALAQTGDFQNFLPIIILTVVIQTIDNIIIQPLCFSKTVDMHPVTVIFVCIIGNTMMGIAGMLLAIPIATILKTSVIETYWGLKNYHITA